MNATATYIVPNNAMVSNTQRIVVNDNCLDRDDHRATTLPGRESSPTTCSVPKKKQEEEKKASRKRVRFYPRVTVRRTISIDHYTDQELL
jgi:hypothetical protein